MEGIGRLPNDWEPSDSEYKEIIGKAVLFRAAHEIAREIGISAYRINVVSYTVSLLMWKTEQTIDFGRVWDLQDIAPHWKAWLTECLLKVQTLLAQGSAGKNPGEWYKSESCWDHIKQKAEDWPLNAAIEDEIAGIRRRPAGGPRQADNTRKCTSIDAQEWLAIYRWCEARGTFSVAELNVASRMAELAISEWRRAPTERQAEIAGVLIDSYHDRLQEEAAVV
jgi:hypothetical protein